MTGAVGQRRVPTPFLAGQLIPVPPLYEQCRIVARLEEALSEIDKGVESLKTAQQLLRVYRQAILKNALEGALTARWRSHRSAAPWKETTLGDQLSYLTSGSRGWAKYYATEGDIFIRAQNLKHDELDLNDTAYVALPESSEGSRTRVRVGDLLITITGANVTKAALVKADFGRAYVNQHVALARPGQGVNPEYLYWFLVAEAAGRRQLTAAAYGAGKPGLNLDNIRSVRMSLPPLDEQTEIVTYINSLVSIADSVRLQIEAEFGRSKVLREAILNRAFLGRRNVSMTLLHPAS